MRSTTATYFDTVPTHHDTRNTKALTISPRKGLLIHGPQIPIPFVIFETRVIEISAVLGEIGMLGIWYAQ